jgi:cyanophycinase
LLYTVIMSGVGMLAFLGWNYWSFSHAATNPKVVIGVVRPSGGALVICGGGGIPDTVRARFTELAGGPKARIVVIPTASMYADDPRTLATLDPWKKFQPASLQLFHTRKRALADDPEFIKPLSEATGVWIGGGKQKLLSDAYVGTEVERQLMALLDRGGVIGGSSAGAAIMTRVMITDGRTKAIMGTGFDFLHGAVVDQHFMKRNRVGRLLGVLEDHPDLIGFGIDERTALVVNVRDSRLRVIGDSYVLACVPDQSGRPARLEILKPGDEADVATLKDPGKQIVSSVDLEAL